MANIKVKQYTKRQFGGFSPYGNVTHLTFGLKTASDGSAVNSDVADPVAAGDVLDLGQLPAGMRLDDASIFVKTGMTATITGKLGFKYEDGVNDTDVPQDDDYFGTGFDLAAAGRKRANTGELVTLPKTARLILTTAVAANAKASDIKVLVVGELTGAK